MLMANDKHGKSTMIRMMVSQGLGKAVDLHKKGIRDLITPWGRSIDAYVFGRSYQEVEKRNYKSVVDALNGNDSNWRERELIVLPSHVAKTDLPDIKEMIDAGHSAGFDVIAASVLLTPDTGSSRGQFPDIWRMDWDERWTVPNPRVDDPAGQLDAIGRDLWTWISKAVTRQ